MRHEYLSVYQLENDTINSNTINVDEIAVGGGGLVTKTHDFATDGHISGTYDLFTITGTVRMKILPVVETDLAGGGGANAQVTLGFSGATTVLIGQTSATGLDAGEIWSSSTLASNLRYLAVSGLKDFIATGPASPVQLVVTSTSTSTGKITFYCWWEPITEDAEVAAA
jgi:hypothetical protein